MNEHSLKGPVSEVGPFKTSLNSCHKSQPRSNILPRELLYIFNNYSTRARWISNDR